MFIIMKELWGDAIKRDTRTMVIYAQKGEN